MEDIAVPNMEVLVAVVAFTVTIVFLWWKSSVKNFPPGPWGLPLVGYMPFLSTRPHLAFTKLAKVYGSVFSIRLGSRNVVVLNDFQSTKEAFTQDTFFGRPPDMPFVVNKESIDTGALFGFPWKEQRRLTLHLLRDVGFGKSKMEEHMQEEIKQLLEHLQKNADKPFCMRELLVSSMSNNVAALVFGKRFRYDDPTGRMLLRTIRLSNKESGQVGWTIFFPWLRRLLTSLNIGTVDKQLKICQEMKEYIKKEIEEHERTLDPNNIRDFMDGYLLEMKKRNNDPAFCRPVLQDLCQAFFSAGSDTVRQTVEWLVLIAASNPKAQQRIQKEIGEVVGQNRLPTWTDVKEMPYTEAFIQETMRWRTNIPINLLRYTMADTELNGYFIPKHTYILSNQWAIHHDPVYWGPNADEFCPERFLDEEGKAKKLEHHVPFSLGKRSCPGEPLAKVEVFLYFVSILQKFEAKLPQGKVGDFEGEFGIGLEIKPQDIVLIQKN